MGLALRNPLVASASPLSQTVDGVRRLADAGVGAVVLYSLFEEQLRREAAENARLVDAGTESFAESLSYFPAAAEEEAGPRRYLSLLERAAAAVDVPVIGSLNGVTPGGWADYARAMQDAGAAAIELNIYYLPGDPRISGRDVEQRHLDVLARVKDSGQRAGRGQAEPVLQLDRRDGAAARRGRRGRAGAVQPLPPARHRRGDARRRPGRRPLEPRRGAAAAHVDRAPARTGARLARGDDRSRDSADVAKYLLAGADVVMTASALLRHGPEHASVLLDGLSDWMARKGFAAVDELRGMLAVPPDADAALYERAGYVGALREANRGSTSTEKKHAAMALRKPAARLGARRLPAVQARRDSRQSRGSSEMKALGLSRARAASLGVCSRPRPSSSRPTRSTEVLTGVTRLGLLVGSTSRRWRWL